MFQIIDKEKQIYSYHIKVYNLGDKYLGDIINNVELFIFKHKNSYISEYNLSDINFYVHNRDYLYENKMIYYVDKIYINNDDYYQCIKYYNKKQRKQKLNNLCLI
jgi:hypothetical protein